LVPFFARAKKRFSTAEWLVKGRPRGERRHVQDVEGASRKTTEPEATADVVAPMDNE
jgi:hypothetical protein